MGKNQVSSIERVREYPRPPRLEPFGARVRVVAGGRVIVDTTEAWRVLETTHPPGVYVPREAVDPSVLVRSSGRSTVCEWKGLATYWDVVLDGFRAPRAAWSYEHPTPNFEPIAGFVSFYPGLVDACYVDDDLVTPQASTFYGGWIYPGIEGPFKG